jgi:hypothetical protein
LPPQTAEELSVRDQLQKDVKYLAVEIGEKNIHQYANLCAAAEYIQGAFE